MKGKGKVVTPEVSVPASGSVSEASKVKTEEKKEQHSCGECAFYNHSTERAFHRDGIRQGLVETRAICKASKERTKASGHLVKKESDRPCFERGVYIVPVKETKKPKAEKKTKKEPKTVPPSALQDAEITDEEQIQTMPVKRNKHTKVESAVNILNGKVSRLEKNRNGRNDKKVYVEVVA